MIMFTFEVIRVHAEKLVWLFSWPNNVEVEVESNFGKYEIDIYYIV